MLSIVHKLSRWDSVRLMAQAASAAIAAYLACYALGVQDYSWAVISALLVSGASVGNNLKSAATRVAGAVAGLVIAIACIFTIGIGSAQTLISLAVAVSAMSLLAGLRPELHYGLVTVAILILAPGFDAVETAWSKAGAITLGAVIGALAGALILPMSAHRRAEEHLGHALHRCADLLSACVERLTGKDDVELSPIHKDIRSALGAAQSMTEQSQFRRVHAHENRTFPDDLLHAVQRLWHTLVILDRIAGRVLSDAPRRILEKPLQDAVCATRDYLAKLGDAVAGSQAPKPPSTVRERIDAVMDALDDMRRENATAGLSDEETERVFALSFAFEESYRNIRDIARLMGTDETDRSAGGGVREPRKAA